MAATGLTLRNDLTRKLTWDELDGNFIYLDDKTPSMVSTSNEVIINVSDTEISGKQYQSFANAFDYLLTQPVSSASTWSVKFSGVITEDIIIPEFVAVVGDSMSSKIDGDVSFASAGTPMGISNNILQHCTIGNLIVTGGQYIALESTVIMDCVSGSSANGISIMNSIIMGGDYRHFTAYCQMMNCSIFGFGTTIILSDDCDINHSFLFPLAPNSIVLYGINTVQSILSNIDNVVLNSGSYSIYNSVTNGNFSILSGSTFNIINSSINDDVTVVSGILNTLGCVFINTPTLIGGTWANIGNVYNNRVSRLVAENVQDAIDELDVNIANSTRVLSETGNTIMFDYLRVYNYSGTTGNIIDDLTDAKLGIVQKIYHNDSVEPTFPAGWVLLGTTTYTTSVMNIIYAEWVDGTRVEYWIINEN